MIGKGVNEVKESQMFENGRREREGVTYLNGTIVSLFKKKTKVWKQYGVEPNLVRQTRGPTDVRG